MSSQTLAFRLRVSSPASSFTATLAIPRRAMSRSVAPPARRASACIQIPTILVATSSSLVNLATLSPFLLSSPCLLSLTLITTSASQKLAMLNKHYEEGLRMHAHGMAAGRIAPEVCLFQPIKAVLGDKIGYFGQ